MPFHLFQVKGCGEASCDSLFAAPIKGYMLGVLSACLSALAGVYTEFLMKKNNDSLYWQNVQLYTQVSFLHSMTFSFPYIILVMLHTSNHARNLDLISSSKLLDLSFTSLYIPDPALCTCYLQQRMWSHSLVKYIILFITMMMQVFPSISDLAQYSTWLGLSWMITEVAMRTDLGGNAFSMATVLQLGWLF